MASSDPSTNPKIKYIPKFEDLETFPGVGPFRFQYGWMRDKWIERKERFNSEKSPQNCLLFLGDSITEMWGDDFKYVGLFPSEEVEKFKVVNRGISGDTSRGVLWRLQEDVLALKPRAVHILLGTNDLEEAAPLSTTATNIKLIIEKLKSINSNIQILLPQIFPSSEKQARSVENIKEINRLVEEAVGKEANVHILPSWPLFALPDGRANIEEFPDLVHPNAKGYTKYAQKLLRPKLESLGLLS